MREHPASKHAVDRATPLPDPLQQVARALDEPAALVVRRARMWATSQQSDDSPKLTPVILLIAMIESYRTRDVDQWKGSASIWSLAAKRILKEEARYLNWRGRLMEPAFEPVATLPSGDITETLSGPRSEGIDELLLSALQLRNGGFWKDELGLDHLFAAMLTRSDLPSQDALVELDVATETGVAAVLRGIRKRSDRALWKSFLEKALGESAEVVTAPTALIAARFAADSPDADDLMDVESEARAFARYVAKRELDTPLAIGLFGDWGSGKSFFMNRMRRFVGELTGRGASWCEDIVQIEFNAWHYIESNLWASLVEHMLGALESWSRGENKEKQVDALLRQFESAREVERESEQELESAKQARKDAESELREARTALAERIQRRRRLSAGTLWDAIEQRFAAALASKDHKNLRDKLENAADALGLPAARASARDLRDVLRQASATGGRVEIMLGSLLARQRGGWQWAGLAVMLAAAPFVAGVAWSWVTAFSDGSPTRIGAGAIELSALASATVAWVARGLASAHKALDELASASELLESIVRDRSRVRERALAKAEAQVATANERVEKAETRLSSARQSVDRAQRALEAETPRSRLTRFLKRRLENGDYAKHLGVVSMIRQDFELLSSIMTNRDWSTENRQRLLEAGVDAEHLRMFDRIILYVDDLDRCPADRVVDVLQAVHLLLAFPLFVVVVGVDARWISRSLAQHYPYLLDENVARDLESSAGTPERSGRDSELIASSHDYLEKIFQVPYWVKPMDATASEQFLEGLARQSVSIGKAAPAAVANTSEEPTPDTGAMRETAGESVAGTLPTPDGDESGETHDAPNTVRGTSEIDETKPPRPEPSRTAEPLAPVLAELPLTEHEIAFMTKLAPSVGRSPRRSKRFFNVYQLIRASLQAEERERFVGTRGQALDYRVVMSLLAIVTGSPILAPRFFRAMLNDGAKGESLAEVCGRVENDPFFNASSEWPRIARVLQVVATIGDDDATLERMRHWTRRTMRFSFTARPAGDETSSTVQSRA